jgi:hypothetical protein
MSSRASSLPRWTVWVGKLSIGMKSAAYRAHPRSLTTTNPVGGISLYFCRTAKSRAIRKSRHQPGLPWEGFQSTSAVSQNPEPSGNLSINPVYRGRELAREGGRRVNTAMQVKSLFRACRLTRLTAQSEPSNQMQSHKG